MTEERTLFNELRLVNIALRRGTCATSHEHAEGGLPAVASMMLHYLFHAGGNALQKDVENEFNLRRSTVSRQLQRLEQDGYIIRAAEEGDGRSKRIFLSEKAKAAQTEIVQKFRNVEQYVEAALTPQEKEMFFDLCDKIRVRLEHAES